MGNIFVVQQIIILGNVLQRFIGIGKPKSGFIVRFSVGTN